MIVFFVGLEIHEIVISFELLAKKEFEDEMGAAGRVQRALIPSELPSGGGVEFAAHLESAQDVGGDFYDVIPLAKGRYVVAVADISGKGVPAALLMTSLRTLLRSLVRREDRLAKVIARLNEAVHHDTSPEQYATMFCAILDTNKKTLDYCNAGHVTPYLASPAGELRVLETGGPPIGLLPSVDYSEASEPLTSGTRLIAYTDGVSDVGGPADSSLSPVDLENLIREFREERPDRLVTAIRNEVSGLRARKEWPDDVTVLVAGI